MKELTLKLKYRPKGIQSQYTNLSTRFTIARIGRQWGKSMMAMYRGMKRSIETTGVYWWVEPTIAQTKVHFRRMLEYYPSFIHNHSKSERFVKLKNGSTWFFKGADDPENLEGDTLDGLVLDEAAKQKEETWFQTLLPMLAVKKGWADLLGKPRGNNYFKRIWNLAEKDKDWSRIHLASNTSPFFTDEEYNRVREDTPSGIFQQEYEAEFVDNAGVVFRDIDKYIRCELQDPKPKERYWAGIDLARAVDYTVICIFNSNKDLVAFDRFNNIPWSIQMKRIDKLCKNYDATCLIDSTGVGDPIFDALSKRGLKIRGLKFTNLSKRKLIEDLILSFENNEISLPSNLPELINELNNFEVDRTENDTIKYSAPSGQHDDCVIALALANYYCIKITGSMIESIDDRTF